MNAVITLTTDFGQADGYVAAMKGVLLDISPESRIVDISHSIKPQNIPQAAFVLSTAYPYFPKKTVHLVVVDPEVGSQRRAVILRTPEADFIAPDNGVLSYIIRRYLAKPGEEASPPAESLSGKLELVEVKLNRQVEAVAITNERFFKQPVSPTFHGRDVFAPVAALLSMGFPLPEFGPKLTTLKMMPLAEPHRRPDGSLLGNVIHIDSFGNVITNIREEHLEKMGNVRVDIGSRFVIGVTHTYADGGLVAIFGSSGYMEIALKGGTASALLNARVGDEVTVKTNIPEG